jgi:hypothetical protein
MQSLSDFYTEFRQEWERETEDVEEYLSNEQAFVKIACRNLVEVGISESPVIVKHHTKKTKLDAYEIRSEGDRWQLDIIVCCFEPEADSVVEIEQEKLKAAFNLGREILNLAKDKKLKKLVHESEKELFELANKLENQWKDLELANIYVVTNYSVKVKIKNNQRPLDELQLHYDCFGLDQFYDMENKLETVNPDIVFLESVPCLRFNDSSSPFETVMAVIPGEELARIYRTWGTRLLENNVRAFLQVKGPVNKSIRETLKTSPEMFLAYNNGLAITASDFVIEDGILKSIEDMQIVNGGQTTASLYHFRTDNGESLNKVNVAAKIIKIPSNMDYFDVVKSISRCSNNQNKINASDLDANSPFQKKLGELSKLVRLPGNSSEGKWYYEQLRGGYLTDRSIYKTAKDKKAFDLEYPKARKIEKPDVAKYECLWLQLPNVISLGSQKCFNYYRVNIIPDLKMDNIDEDFYKNLISKAITYRTAEKIAKKNKLTPYTANIVAYGLCLFVDKYTSEDFLKKVWKKQDLDSDDQNKLFNSMRAVQAYFETKKGLNLSEWAKKEECWKEVKTLNDKLI